MKLNSVHDLSSQAMVAVLLSFFGLYFTVVSHQTLLGERKSLENFTIVTRAGPKYLG